MSQTSSECAKKDPDDFLYRVEQGQGLPELRPTTRELIDLFWKQDATARDLIRILASDQKLSQSIVDTSNRKYFQGLFVASTPRQAVARMGFRFSKAMALVTTLGMDLQPLMADNGMRNDFVTRAMCRAVTAREMEDYARCIDMEEALVLGFVWGVGDLLWQPLLGGHPQDACPLDLASLEECLRRERLQAGVDHLQLAAAALRHWGFPPRATACMLCAEEAGPDAVSLRACCEVADLFTRLLFSGFQDVYAVFTKGREHFNLEADELGDVLLTSLGELARMTETLILDLDMQSGLRELLRKSSRSIGQLQGNSVTATRLPAFEALAQASDSRSDQVLQAVAHEVRNPLMAVAGFARKLVATVNPTSRESEYAQVILEEGQRLEAVLAKMHGGLRP
ncbi:MAG: HDOD domain-containing protein [Desulfocurvibacter africanus]